MSDNKNIAEKALDGIGYGASYALTGAGYAGDAVIFLAGGVGMSIVLCSPVILLEGALEGSGEASGRCIGHMSTEVIKNFPESIGEKVYKKTREWRCPNG
jgi:hypothetical protein